MIGLEWILAAFGLFATACCVWCWNRERRVSGLNVQLRVEQHQQHMHFQNEQRKWRYDSLTGLVLDQAFFADLEEHYSNPKQASSRWALMVIHLDDYNALSVGLTADEQERLIRFAAEGISRVVRQVDVVSHGSRDVFWLWFRHLNQAELVSLIAERILNVFSEETILLGEYTLSLFLNIGIALSKTPAISVSSMKNQALYALTMSKKIGHHRYCFYNDQMLNAHREYLFLNHVLSPMHIGHAFQFEFQTLFSLRPPIFPVFLVNITCVNDQQHLIPELTILERAEANGRTQLLIDMTLQHCLRMNETEPNSMYVIPVLLKSLENVHFPMHFMQICTRLGIPFDRIGFRLIASTGGVTHRDRVRESIHKLHYLNVSMVSDWVTAICMNDPIYRDLDAVLIEKSQPFLNAFQDSAQLMLVFQSILEMCLGMHLNVFLDHELDRVYLKLNVSQKMQGQHEPVEK